MLEVDGKRQCTKRCRFHPLNYGVLLPTQARSLFRSLIFLFVCLFSHWKRRTRV